jgi:hypothetical protein
MTVIPHIFLLFLSIVDSTIAFRRHIPSYHLSKFRKYSRYKLHPVLSMSMNKKNSSKIYKLDFSEEIDDKLHKPLYAFGLSEFQMILLRIYVYMVIIIYYMRHIIG